MSGLGITLIALALWIAVSPLVGVALGRAIRRGRETPPAGAQVPAWARQNTRRTRRRR